jgi:nucleoside-diphosphate-sugar epimerase
MAESSYTPDADAPAGAAAAHAGFSSAAIAPTGGSVTVALTGATGFIGRRLAAALAADGHRVRALTRRGGTVAAGIDWRPGDLSNADSLRRLCAGADVVIHCAGAVRGATYDAFAAVNVRGTEALLAARAAEAPTARLLHVSSLAAREPQLSHYAASKAAAERAVRTADARATLLRPPAVYGPGDTELLPLLRGLWSGRGIIPGHEGRFALIHVDDLVGAIAAWLASPAADGECYEVHDGTPAGYDWPAVIATVAALRGAPVRPLALPRPVLAAAAWVGSGALRLMGRAPMLSPGKVRELYHPDWVCNNALFTARTGWQPRIALAAGLAATLSVSADGETRS